MTQNRHLRFVNDFKIFLIMLLRFDNNASELWCIVSLTAILRLSQKRNFTFI